MLKKANTPQILFVLLLAALFRFYNFFSWTSFGMDQEYQAFISKNIVTLQHFPLIGTNVSDTGLYLGPFFSYMSAFVHFLFSGNPLGGSFVASLTGLLVVFLLYKIGTAMFSRRVGMLAALFYSCSFLVVFYDRQYWNPMLMPIGSLLVGYFLFSVLRGEYKNLRWLAITFGLALQSHLSIGVFIPLIIWVVWKKRDEIPQRVFLFSIALFFIIQLPLLLFDIRHDFQMTKAAKHLLSGKQTAVSPMSFKRQNDLFFATLGRFFWVPGPADLFVESGQCRELSYLQSKPPIPLIVLVVFLISTFLWSYFESIRRKLSTQTAYQIVMSIFGITFLVVAFYRRQSFEYYYMYIFPWLAIIFARSIEYMRKKPYGSVVSYFCIIVFIGANLYTLVFSTSSYSYSEKMDAIGFAKKQMNGQHSYSLESMGECPRYGGYRYLFEYGLRRPPNYSYMDSYFGWLYSDTIREEKPDRIVMLSMIDERGSKESLVQWQQEKIRFLETRRILDKGTFGRIQVYILGYDK